MFVNINRLWKSESWNIAYAEKSGIWTKSTF